MPAEFSFIFIALLIIIGLSIFFRFVPVGLWITARSSGVPISMGELAGMRFRKINPSIIVQTMIKAVQAEVLVETSDLESHYLAGGNINQVVDALIMAERAKIDLDFEKAAAIDLAGRNVFEAVQLSVNPRVITTPEIAAVAQDGIEVIVKAKVTVKANIDKLVGGAGEETIIARVGEGIVTTIGSSDRHSSVLENPDSISEVVIQKGLDSGTAFEILSIDIADVDVGHNVGAELQRDQAEADKNIAQAKAEERRAAAIALEQENKADIAKAKADVIKAEAEVPKALAEALRNGNLTAKDYYELQNIEADTKMRDSIGKNNG